jgi:hypothetical protein
MGSRAAEKFMEQPPPYKSIWPLPFSVLAILQAILPRVSSEMLVTLLTALANMNASYAITHRYNGPRSKTEVSAIACMAAAPARRTTSAPAAAKRGSMPSRSGSSRPLPPPGQPAAARPGTLAAESMLTPHGGRPMNHQHQHHPHDHATAEIDRCAG